MKLERDKYLVEDEFKRLTYQARTRPHVNALRDYALLSTGGGCGLRPIELIGIRHGDIGRIQEEPRVIGVWRAKKRGAHYSEVAIPASAAQALTKYVRTLSNERRKNWLRIFPITTRQANRIFKHYAELAGLNSRYSIYSLRHFRGMQVYQNEKDIHATQMALGHSSMNSTQIYVHTVDHLEKAGRIDVKIDPEEQAFLDAE